MRKPNVEPADAGVVNDILSAVDDLRSHHAYIG
jgi:hypothetical protein